MFGIGMPELIIIFIIALIVIGPQKLPELAKSLGKGLAEFKRASEDFQRSVQEESLREEAKNTTANHVQTTDGSQGETPAESRHESPDEKKENPKA